VRPPIILHVYDYACDLMNDLNWSQYSVCCAPRLHTEMKNAREFCEVVDVYAFTDTTEDVFILMPCAARGEANLFQ